MLPHGGELFAMPEGWVQITTIGGYAFMLQIFVIGVKTDLGMIVKSGKKAVAIAFFGTITPHLAMYAAGAALKPRLPVAWKAFIVVCCTLEDLNLLSSKLCRLAMSAALIGDLANFSIAGVTSYLLAPIPSEKI
jgi:Kef-type K+ transport system membrane component KefB